LIVAYFYFLLKCGGTIGKRIFGLARLE